MANDKYKSITKVSSASGAFDSHPYGIEYIEVGSDKAQSKWYSTSKERDDVFNYMNKTPIMILVQENFPNAKISSWASDLYIEYTNEIFLFCKKNFPYPNQVTRFYSHNFKKYYIEIPFAYLPYWDKKETKLR